MSAAAGSYVNAAPAEAAEKVSGGAKFLDVRTPEEFAEGSAAGAINIPLVFINKAGQSTPNPDFVAQAAAALPDQGAAVVTSCMFGRRGEGAAKKLAAAGYCNIVNVTGGLAGWHGAGLPTTGDIKIPESH